VNKDVQDTIKKLKEYLEDLHEDTKSKISSKNTNSDKNLQKSEKDYLYYANIVNPETEKPYIIPMLCLTDPDYTNKYVEYMKVLENQPDMFKKILNWN